MKYTNKNKIYFFSETQSFVDLLFKKLETQEFNETSVKEEPESCKTPPATVPQTSSNQTVEEDSPQPPVTDNTPTALHVNGTAPPIILKREKRKSESEIKEEKEREKGPRSR